MRSSTQIVTSAERKLCCILTCSLAVPVGAESLMASTSTNIAAQPTQAQGLRMILCAACTGNCGLELELVSPEASTAINSNCGSRLQPASSYGSARTWTVTL